MGAGGAFLGGIVGALAGLAGGAYVSREINPDDERSIERYRDTRTDWGSRALTETDRAVLQGFMGEERIARMGGLSVVGAILGATLGAAIGGSSDAPPAAAATKTSP